MPPLRFGLKTRLVFLSVLAAFALFCLPGAVLPLYAEETPAPLTTARPKTLVATMDTRIVPGCLLTISIEGEEDLSHAYPVDEKGRVHFKLSDSTGVRKTEWDVPVQGKTVAEARAVLTESLSEYFRAPEIHVAIIRMPGLSAEAYGELLHPGKLMLPLNSRLSDLLALCGTRPLSDLSNILIRRQEAAANSAARTIAAAPGSAKDAAYGAVRSFTVNFVSAGAGDSTDDPLLQEGDKVYVWKLAELPPPPELQLVRIVGEIKTDAPSVVNNVVQSADGAALPLSRDMTVKDAFERVGGLKDTADRTHIYLGRTNGTTAVLDADLVEANDPAHNLKLRPGDLIIVGKKDRSQIYAVLGEVNAPNTFEFHTGQKIRLLDAIARAGDLSKKADPHRGVLSRGYLLDPAKARAIPFDPELVKKGEQPNMELDAGDAVLIETRRKKPTIWQQLLPLALHFLPF